jgi:hypothetical protein
MSPRRWRKDVWKKLAEKLANRMDMSGFAVALYALCASICIPSILTGSTYAIISFIPRLKTNLTNGRLALILVSIFVLALLFTCATILFLTRDFYVM